MRMMRRRPGHRCAPAPQHMPAAPSAASASTASALHDAQRGPLRDMLGDGALLLVAQSDSAAPAASDALVSSSSGDAMLPGVDLSARGCAGRVAGASVQVRRSVAGATESEPSRRRRREREGQRLRVGAGAQRVAGADRLPERDRRRVVGDRLRPGPQRDRGRHAADGQELAATAGPQRLRQRERAVDEPAGLPCRSGPRRTASRCPRSR